MEGLTNVAGTTIVPVEATLVPGTIVGTRGRCRYFETRGGCSRGTACRYSHDPSRTEAAPALAAAATPPGTVPDSRPTQAASQLRGLCRDVSRAASVGAKANAGAAWAGEADRRIRALTAQLRADAAARGILAAR